MSPPTVSDIETARGPTASQPVLLPWMRWLLRFSGGYNLLVGLNLLFFYHELFKTLGLQKPSPVMFVQLVGLLVGLFGAGYLMVARRPLENRNLLWLGLWSKALGCGLSFYHVAIGNLPLLYVPIVIFSDLIYLPPFYIIARRLDRLAGNAAASPAP
jgi:hypothetical protein